MRRVIYCGGATVYRLQHLLRLSSRSTAIPCKWSSTAIAHRGGCKGRSFCAQGLGLLRAVIVATRTPNRWLPLSRLENTLENICPKHEDSFSISVSIFCYYPSSQEAYKSITNIVIHDSYPIFSTNYRSGVWYILFTNDIVRSAGVYIHRPGRTWLLLTWDQNRLL